MDPVEHHRLLGRVVNLCQSLGGTITPNYRAVSLDLTPTAVCLTFLLERDDDAEREDIDGIAFDYQALEAGMPNPCEVVTTVVVSSRPGAVVQLPGFRVFSRKE